jgi:hypothetical protein
MDRIINAEKISKLIRKDIDRKIKERNFLQKEELIEYK